MATTCPRKPSSAALAVFLLSLLILQLHNHECKADDDPVIPAERDALIDFMNKAKYCKSEVNWHESMHVCNWTGVTCTLNKTVTYFQLPAKCLAGEIPPNTIGRLIGLRGLSLRANKLSGKLPDDFSNLTYLTRLSLENNSFSGNIPSYFSNFTRLVLLTLNNNNFTGKIPDIRSNKLKIFNVSFNHLEGEIPASLAKFTNESFTQNDFLCGRPTNNTCNESLPLKEEPEKKKKKTPIIVGISIGSGVVLVILLCCIQRKTCTQTPKSPLEPKVKVVKNKLVVFDNHGFNSFDVEDLLKASEEVLGEGCDGRSYKQVLEGKNVTVVVKRLKHVVAMENEFRTTVEVLGKMKNEYVVPLIGYYYSQDEKWLVYAYMDGYSLYDRLHGSIASRQTRLDWNHRMRIALGSAKGLAYLHEDDDDEKSIVHGNIHSSNILLQEKTNIKAMVSDYGLNTLFDVKCSQDHHGAGYCAPEVENTRAVTFKSDVYSFGVLLLELLTSKIPKKASLGKEGDQFSKLLESVVCGEPNDEIFDVGLRMGHNIEEMRQFLQIAKECLSIEPNQRPSMKDVVRKMEAMWPRQSMDDHPKGCDYTPSTETGDTPSTITYDTPSTITP